VPRACVSQRTPWSHGGERLDVKRDSNGAQECPMVSAAPLVTA
jgi:hypothetical protein